MVAPDRNFRSGAKCGRLLYKYHIKGLQAHSGMELGTLIGWADQLTHILDPPMFLLHFHSRMRFSW